ncbi:MAG: TRAP transporter small permease subunit [Bosea sp. (in: a-proteobacteria)]|uniref:TRAP transporter small permease n=1 Tax=Bosea sp. (in: a-proteobacteria) TaxID=1871050 RepID=UPI0027336EFB|nr:TRAP transporter small permease subunit [Bosea sp. (in: a-proteobacteria)]MDP3258045.1 TRAP transporter small permease subunit [Bosea sp. (in: a-proteobacteria)]MDP3321320.1 TRAP transporter small permease subunit [Bosea sp. (in: a-proteobacteria)]
MQGVALLGGVLLITLSLTVVISVTLRSDLVGSAGIPGDFELVQMATAVAAFCFLPWCQLRRGNIFVDTFTLKLPLRWQRRIDAGWDLVYALVMMLIAWRLAVGARAAFATGENTMVLQIPSYLPIGLCAALAALVAACAIVSAVRLARAPA